MSKLELMCTDEGIEAAAKAIQGRGDYEDAERLVLTVIDQLDKFAAEAECAWTISDDAHGVHYETSCGKAWLFDDGESAEYHGINYCHNCGGKRVDAAHDGDSGE